MKDPVTAISGITYDRESIERWLFKSRTNTICPVTKQPLPRDSDLTPNHNLRRLIQAWCSVNATNGVDRIPTPKPPLSKFHVINLIRDLYVPDLQIKTLQKLEALAAENERNRVFMVEAGLIKALVSFIVSCYENSETKGVEEALSLFYLVNRTSIGQSTAILTENGEIVIESLVWVLGGDDCFGHDNVVVKSHATCLMKVLIQKANPRLLERLNPEFFRIILSNLRPEIGISQQGIVSLLHILLDTCPWGRNGVVLVELGAVFDLIELELRNRPPEKKTTELVLGILYHLCSCADGRAQLLNHNSGIAIVTRRILKVSSMADERAIFIIWLISKYCGTNGVLMEMVRVGTVAKLCMVMQANCGVHLKEKAKEILRTHSDVWKDSPCSEVATLTRFAHSYN
ncbi:hypothetical protein DH2020_018219 [Rehmannia glutinosa]|uniref:U-box domain-containing protein n=1 Tax=Rehmannia glutinosa TaxID=99300 RepID=A0ABR0WIP4_REHGL